MDPGLQLVLVMVGAKELIIKMLVSVRLQIRLCLLLGLKVHSHCLLPIGVLLWFVH